MNEQAPEAGRASETEMGRPSPRIYVASLSDYNAGRLYGAWLDADQETDQLLAEVAVMLATSPKPGAEEWAIHDYEGFGAVELSEYESLENVTRLARGIAEHGPAYAAWAAWVGLAEAAPEAGFDDAFLGHWQSVEEYAEAGRHGRQPGVGGDPGLAPAPRPARPRGSRSRSRNGWGHLDSPRRSRRGVGIRWASGTGVMNSARCRFHTVAGLATYSHQRHNGRQ